MDRRLPAGLFLGCLILPPVAISERREHDAHVHGLAEMDVAVLAGEVEIALRSPAMNLVGFEHAPRTEDQEHDLHAALESLRDGAALFAFGDAHCRLLEAEVRHEYADTGHPDEHGHGRDDHAGEHAEEEHGHDEDGHAGDAEHGDATHSGVRAHYRFECGDEPPIVDARLFERFPLTETIRVQYLTDDSQGAQTLTPDAPVLRLE